MSAGLDLLLSVRMDGDVEPRPRDDQSLTGSHALPRLAPLLVTL